MSLSTNTYIAVSEDTKLANYITKSSFSSSFYTKNLSTTNLTINNSLTTNTIGSSNNVGSILAGSGLGSGGSCSVNSNSNNLYGVISLNSGTSPTTAGNIVATITLTNSFTSTSSWCIFINSNSSNSNYIWYAQPSAVNKFNLYCGTTLPASTNNIIVNYLILGN
jgi:hypothetical protein